MKKITAIILTVTLLFAMTACSKEAGNSSGAEPAPQKQSEQTESNLRMIVIESYKKDVELILAAYKEAKPDVNVELVTAPDFGALAQNMLAAHQAGDDYDLTLVNHVDTRAYVSGDILLSLDQYIEADGIQYGDIVYPSQLESGQVDGVQYTVPVNTDSRVLAINKTIFDKNGLQVPKTLEDMLEVAKVITENGDYGFVNSMTRNDYVSTYEQGVFLKGVGGTLYKMENGKPTATIDTPEMREFLNFNLELLKYMPKDCLTMTEDDGRKAFASGNVGMYVFGPWEFGYLSDMEFDMELILIPSGPAGHCSTSGGYQLGICSGTAQPDAAWELFKFITTSPENMAKMATTGLPTAEKAFDCEPFTDEKYQIFQEQLATSYLPQEPVANMNEVVAEFSTYWSDLLFGKITVDELCAQAQERVQALLDQGTN